MDPNQDKQSDPRQSLNYEDLKSSETTRQVNKPLGPKINLKPYPHEIKELKKTHKTIRIHKISRETKKKVLSKIFNKKTLKYAGIGIGSFLIFALIFNLPVIFLRISYSFKKPEPAKVQQAVVAENNKSQAQKVSPQNLIMIPKINVNAPVIYENSRDEGTVLLALRNGVVIYGGTALPGQKGNSVIIGHSSNDWWEPGDYKFIFALLDQVTNGDKIQINYDSKKYVYEVIDKKVVEPNNLSVLDPTPSPVLTLITCTPPGTSWKRLIVTAKQIEPTPEADKKALEAVGGAALQPKGTPLPSNAPSLLDQIQKFFTNLF
ncbi:MAG: sortase [bacterium]|nr:sortase [bacterium]